MMLQAQLTAEGLLEELVRLLRSPGTLAEMGVRARGLAHPNAAQDIAAMAARVAGIEEG